MYEEKKNQFQERKKSAKEKTNLIPIPKQRKGIPS